MKPFFASCFRARSIIGLLWLLVGLGSLSALAQTRYVSTTGTQPASAATSWGSSTTDLQGAINSLSATGGEVWVAAGVYKPTSSTARTSSFSMRNNVAIYGGFVGDEAALINRPLVNPVTGNPSSSTLSGDIGTVGSRTDNSYHVISNPQGLTTTAILDGFVIMDGNANGSGSNGNGGGMYNEGSESNCHPTITNCLFLNNRAAKGGAMFNNTTGSPAGKCSPVLTSCLFQSNSATSGGGLFNNAQASGNIASPVLTSCVFQSNSANNGGAIYVTSYTSGTSQSQFTYCQFLNNIASNTGGAIYNDGQNNGNSDATFQSCLFDGNRASTAGAVYCYADGNVPYGTSSPTFINCAFQNNSASGDGGVFYNLGSSTNSLASLTLVNCSLQNNSAGGNGAVFYNWGYFGLSNPVLVNVVVFGNGGSKDFYNRASASVTATYSLFEPASVTVTGMSVSGPGNLTTVTVSPFASTVSCILAANSSAINAGDPATSTATVGQTDLGGNPRVVGGVIDMGAYETQGTPPTITGFAASPATVCAGSLATFTATIGNVSGSYNYTLSNGSGPVSGTTSNTAFSETLTASGAGTQTYTLIVSGSGITTIAAITVLVNSVAITVTPSPTITSGNTVTLTASGATSYTWTGGSTSGVFIATPVSTTTYSVTGASVVGCTSSTGVTITVVAPICYSVVYVTQNGAGLQNGSSWANAYPGTMLQTAINSASSCSGEVWVAAGLYKPTSGTARSVSFQMVNGVAIYGGFVGSETALSGRPTTNPVTGNPSSSTLSGDIGTLNNENDNSYHVISNTNVTASARLDGFVITRGYANIFVANNSQGGAIYNTNSSPTIANCLFQGNSGHTGGAFYNENSSNPTLTNCVLQSNMAMSNEGGAVYNTASSPALTNCRLQGNRSQTYGGAIYNTSSSPVLTSCSLVSNTTTYGGAIYHTGGSLTLTNCLLQNNQAQSFGGAIYNINSSPVLTSCSLVSNRTNQGGSIYNDAGNPRLTNCLLQSNTGTQGGGFYNNSGNPTLTSCTLQSNTATNMGGGLYASGGSLTLTSCMFQSNASPQGGAILNSAGSLALTSLTLLNNSASNFGGGSDAGGGINNRSSSSFTLTGGLIQGNTAPEGGGIYTNSGTARITNVLFVGNNASQKGGGIWSSNSLTLTNCSFQSNSAVQQGGGFNNFSTVDSRLVNCSFQANVAPKGGALFNANNITTLINGVFWNNGGGDTFTQSNTGSIVLNYSLFEPTSVTTSVNVSGPGNLTTTISPFASTTSTELVACSPAIDRGNNATYTAVTSLTTDLAGNPRFYNSGTVDMGAYEFAGEGQPVNFSLLGSATATCTASPTLTLSGSETGVSYQLQRDGVDTGTATIGTGLTISFGSQPLSGTYTVLATRTSNNCTALMATSATVVSSTAVPTVSISATSGTLTCAITSVTLTATTTETALLWSNGATAKSLTVNTSGTYAVTVTNAGGCTAVSNSLTISQNTTSPTSPTLTASHGGTLSCGQTTLTLTASATGSGLSYSFVGAGIVAQSGNSATVNAANTFTVVITGANGCTASATAVVESSTTVTSVSLVASGAISCTTTSVTLTASPSNLTYTFGGGATQLGSTNQATVSGGGTYSVVVTNANGCSAVAQVTVASNTAAPTSPTLTASAGGTLSCGQTTLTLTASATGSGLSYAFAGPSGVLVGSGATRVISTSGVYSVTMTGANGCTASASTAVYSNTITPSLSLSPSSATLTCGNPTVSLSAVGVGSFRWSTGAVTNIISVTSANIYSVTLTGANGCTALSSATVVNGIVTPSLSVTPSSGTLSCGNPMVSLSAIGSGTVRWSTGASTSVISATVAGLYSVTLTDVNGCTASTSATVSGTVLRTATVTADGPVGCGRTSALVSVQAVGGTSFTLLGPGSYSLVNTTGQFSVTAGGSYTGLAGQSGGCVSAGEVVVSSGGLPPSASNFRASGVLGPGSCTVRLLATGTGNSFVMTGPTGYVFSNVYRNAGTYEVFGNDVRQPGTYTLTVYSGSCSATYTTVVTGTACTSGQ